MLCKWCGMESSTTDKCSWCHRPFTTIVPAKPGNTPAAQGSNPAPPALLRTGGSGTLVDMEDDSEESPLAAGRTAPPTPRAAMMPGAYAPSQPGEGGRPESASDRTGADRALIPNSHMQRSPAPGHPPAPGVPPSRSTRIPAPGMPAARAAQTTAVPATDVSAARAPRNLAAPSIPVLRPSTTGPAPGPAQRPGTAGPSPGTPVPRATTTVNPPAPGTSPDRFKTPDSTGLPLRPPPLINPQQPRESAPPAPQPQAPQNRGRPMLPNYLTVDTESPAPTQARSSAPAPEGSRGATGQADPTARTHAASIAHGMPFAEPGGLADGMSAPRSHVPAESHLPAMNAVGTEQSKYYPGKVVDATAGTHYDAVTGRAVDASGQRNGSEIEIEWEPVISMPTLVMRYLCAFAGVIGITCLLAHAYKEYYVLTLLGALFCSGVLLPVMDVVPKQRDDSDDIWIFAGLVMLFGPAIGLIIYMVIGLMKQSVNPAVVGCFIVSSLLQVAVYLAASPTVLLFGPPWVQTGFDLRTLFINWCSLASLAGWASANVFHRFDE